MFSFLVVMQITAISFLLNKQLIVIKPISDTSTIAFERLMVL
jgi:hypothetical protein